MDPVFAVVFDLEAELMWVWLMHPERGTVRWEPAIKGETYVLPPPKLPKHKEPWKLSPLQQLVIGYVHVLQFTQLPRVEWLGSCDVNGYDLRQRALALVQSADNTGRHESLYDFGKAVLQQFLSKNGKFDVFLTHAMTHLKKETLLYYDDDRATLRV